MTENRIKFDNAAKDWDKSNMRLTLAKNITDAMLDKITFDKSHTVMDFGCGTGLVGLSIAPFVKKLIGADLSKAMLEAFDTKARELNIPNAQTLHLEVDSDFSHLELDAIVSSMAVHHVENPSKLFDKFSKSIKSGGFLVVADLAKEDGTFHDDNSGVYHFGFSDDEWNGFFVENGFEKPMICVAHTMQKPNKDYNIMLCYAVKL